MEKTINLQPEEIKLIEDIYERKVALENLTKIIDIKDEEIYNKLIQDYAKTIKNYENWWKKITVKYNLNGNYMVDFINRSLKKIDN